MLLWKDLIDGQEHNLQPGEDFSMLGGRVEEWVPTMVQPAGGLLQGESPIVGWVRGPGSVGGGVAEGWSSVAIWLRALADAHGIRVKIYQANYRSSSAAPVEEVRYVFKVVEEEDGGSD